MKKLAIITITYLSFFLILIGIFGKTGLIVNQRLEREYQILEQRVEEKKVTIDTLERQSQLLSTSDALDDVALRLGYNKDGEKVYFFTDEDIVEYKYVEKIESEDEKVFTGIKTIYLALISLVIPLIFIIIFVIQSKAKNNDSDDDLSIEEKNDYGDIVF